MAGSSFRDAFQGALKTTESMESIFREASERYGVDVNLLSLSIYLRQSPRQSPALIPKQFPLQAPRGSCS